MKPKVFFAKSDPKLKFSVYQEGNFFIVMSQFENYQMTEACDDWFARREAAEDVAEQMANNA